MKLTKSKLKQLIKEAFETEEEFLEAVPEGEEEGEDLGGETIDTVDEFMKTAQTFYDSLPEEKKRAMTQAFEIHFDKWEEELEGGTEEEYEEEYEEAARDEDLYDVGGGHLVPASRALDYQGQG